MSKLVEIADCGRCDKNGCGFVNGRMEDVCLKTGRVLTCTKAGKWPIPSWCPLPNAPKEGADIYIQEALDAIGRSMGIKKEQLTKLHAYICRAVDEIKKAKDQEGAQDRCPKCGGLMIDITSGRQALYPQYVNYKTYACMVCHYREEGAHCADTPKEKI